MVSAWVEFNSLKIIETMKSQVKSILEDSKNSKLFAFGLTGSQWKYKQSVIDELRELFNKDNAVKMLKNILKAINVVLCSLFAATGVPGLELMKEFKDFVEITIQG